MRREAAKKPRQERRKAARQEKKHKKHESWVHLQRQNSQQLKRQEQTNKTFGDSKPKSVNKSTYLLTTNLEEKQDNQHDVAVKLELQEHNRSAVTKMRKEKKGLKRKSNTKFEEYLNLDMKNAGIFAEEDLEIEKRLAKKLKLKYGKLRGMNDGINVLFEGIPSVLDSFGDEEEVRNAEDFPIERVKNGTTNKKYKKQKALEEFSEDDIDGDVMGGDSELEETCGAEVELEEDAAKKPSHKMRRKRKKSKQKQDIAGDTNGVVSEPAEAHSLQDAPTKAPEVAVSVKYVAPRLRARAENESEEHTQIRRRIRGLLNRLSESNVESVTGEIAAIFCSITRSASTQIVSDEVLAACSGGPRGNQQYAAVFAAFVAGMACSVGVDFSAKFMASLAKSFEDEYLKEDNISLRNLTLLLSYLYIFGVCSSDLIYDFLTALSKRLTEVDVSTILIVLQCCGMKLRSDDPSAMKNFIQSVQNRVNELKASPGEGQANTIGKRMEFMLETICDIKNNKKKPKEETVQHTRIKKWLQKLRVEDIVIRGLKWSTLLDPHKKGQWWLSGDMAAAVDNIEDIANTIDKEVLEAQKMLQLAASQRMNTDARKAIFCVIMSAQDCLDALEKLLRLDLPGKQDREIMRVLMECCLQEKAFNKYYTILATMLCERDKNHKFTLQFCLWDHFKELESMELLRSMHLAKFVAEMVASFTLSLAVLKSVDLTDARQLTPKRIMHFQMLFEFLFEYPDKVVWNTFTRVAVTPELEELCHGLEFFMREYVVKTRNALTGKFKVAKKALGNTEGVLM